MAHGTPDYVSIVQVVVTVDNVPIVPEPATERAAGDTGNYSGNDQTYQEVALWTVAPGKVGELKEILILTDDYDHTWIKITIGAVIWCEDWEPQGAMPIIFEDMKLAEGTIVKVEAEADEDIAIDVDAIIVGKEIG